MQKTTKLLKPKKPENLITKVNGFSFSSPSTISQAKQGSSIIIFSPLSRRQRAGENYIEKSFLNTEQPSLPLLYGLRNFFLLMTFTQPCGIAIKALRFFSSCAFERARSCFFCATAILCITFFMEEKQDSSLLLYTVSVPFFQQDGS